MERTKIQARAVLTGGAGFIGSNIARELAGLGCEVKVIDNLSSGRKQNLAGLGKSIKFVRGDITDSAMLERELDGTDCILHHAALISAAGSVQKPVEYNNVNINGTVNLLEAARKKGVKRFVFASSSSVYGNAEQLPTPESATLKPRSPYAVSKIACEHYCRMYYELYGLETIILRYFNVFGPRQNPNSRYSNVIPAFISALLHNRQPVIFGSGEQSRDFTYVQDSVEANIAAMRALKKAAGCTFNIASGRAASINTLLEKIKLMTGSSLQPLHEEALRGDVMHTLGDNSMARETLGWKPRHSLEEGLRKTVEWYRETQK